MAGNTRTPPSGWCRRLPCWDTAHGAELFGLLNPIRHTATPEDVARYASNRLSRRVTCTASRRTPPRRLDLVHRFRVLALPGRRGNALGLRLRGKRLSVAPIIPRGWPSFEITFRHRGATYRITVDNAAGTGQGVRALVADGQPCDGWVQLSEEGTHEVRVVLG